MTRHHIALFVASAVVGLTLTHASTGLAQEEWWPPPDEEHDWVQLVSSEWLRGELIAMYDDLLEFDSEELDLLELDWADVKSVRTARISQIRFVGGEIATGLLIVANGEVRVIGEEEQRFERSEIVSIAAGDPTERNFWSGKASIGLNIRSGNSDQTESNFRATFLRRTVLNRVILDYIGAYNITDDVVATNNHRATARWDRFVSDRFFIEPVFVEYFRDPFQNIGKRWSFGAGVGYQLVDTHRLDWEVEGGPGFTWTGFDTVEEGESETESTAAVNASTYLDYTVTRNIDFIYEYRLQFLNEASGRYNHHMVTTLETELTSLLDLDISWIWDRIQNPRPDADGVVPEQNDYRIVFALGLDF